MSEVVGGGEGLRLGELGSRCRLGFRLGELVSR